jgi:hypothetical protein
MTVVTRKAIDIETMRLRKQLSGLPEDAEGERFHIIDKLTELRQLREPIVRPFEKVRPVNEQCLQAYGVI